MTPNRASFLASRKVLHIGGCQWICVTDKPCTFWWRQPQRTLDLISVWRFDGRSSETPDTHSETPDTHRSARPVEACYRFCFFVFLWILLAFLAHIRILMSTCPSLVLLGRRSCRHSTAHDGRVSLACRYLWPNPPLRQAGQDSR